MDLLSELLLGELLHLLVVEVVVHLLVVEGVGLQGLDHEVAQLEEFLALGGLHGLEDYFLELDDVLGEDFPHQLLGDQGVVADPLDLPFALFQERVSGRARLQVLLHLLDQILQEHLHDVEIVLQVLHDLVLERRLVERLELLLTEQSTIPQLPLLQPDE